MKPFFSILIPSYNRPEYINELLESIFLGGIEEFEVIISDDCSPKSILIGEIVEKYKKTGKVIFFPQSRNLGEVGNKNFLISKSQGKFNIIVGDDDRLKPGSLLKLKKNILNNPGYDLYGFGYSTIDENGSLISNYSAPKLIELSATKTEHLEDIFSADMLPLWIFHPATFCCRSGVEEELGYSYEVGMAEDLYFIFEAILNDKKILVLPDLIFEWRKIIVKSKSSQLNQSSEFLADFSARLKIFNKLYQMKSSKYYSFFQSEKFINRFLIKNILSDKRLNIKQLDFRFKENESEKAVQKVIKENKSSPNAIIRLKQIMLLPKRIMIFINIFGFQNTLIFVMGLFSIPRIKSIFYKR